jgi:Domain of unknown function (DUF4173)
MNEMMSLMRRGFRIKLALLVVLVAFGDWLFWQNQYGIGNLGIYGLALLAALIISRPATLATWPGRIAVLATALYCSAIIFDISFLSFGMFWTAMCVAALMPFSTRLKDGWQWFWRLVLHGMVSFLNPIFDLIKLNKVSKKRRLNKFGARAALGLLGLPLIGGAIFLALFVQANPVLEEIVNKWKLPAFDDELLERIIGWGVAALLIWSVLRPMRARNLAIPISDAQAPAAPFAIFSLDSIRLALWVFNGLFLMQNGMDMAFLSGLVPLPDTMTMAQYAHRGAYPLVGTALLAGLFVLVILRPASVAAADKLVRLLVIVWIAQNVVLVASSMVRTWDYVQSYSLTELRISALAWMVLVAIGLALICWRMLAGRSGSWLINTNLLTTGLMLTAFCFIDSRALAAEWNVAHAREVGGRGVHLDLCYMGTLGAGAILPLMSLEAKPLPQEFRERVKIVRTRVQNNEKLALKHGGWTYQLAARLAAAEKREAVLPKLHFGPGLSNRGCDGRIVANTSDTNDAWPSQENEQLTPSVAP